MNKSDRNKETCRIVRIHTPCDLIQFRLIPFKLVMQKISTQQMLKMQVDSKLLGQFVECGNECITHGLPHLGIPKGW